MKFKLGSYFCLCNRVEDKVFENADIDNDCKSH